MPQRLVYSPRAYVYTKDSSGKIYDLSNYVTAGEVDRKLNQVSTAQVTLRNPDRVFTKPGSDAGASFHPQDPITIYLERLAGNPVRVFTGYLDTTPYYALYPGTITLQASCTLKRLLYSFFDPSLPYMISFFEQYGWINTGSGSLISSKSFNSKQISTQSEVNDGTQPFTKLQDGSLGKLLWACLWNIGQWQDENIYIEGLPSGPDGIGARMATLMQSMDQLEQQASKEFNSFMDTVIGTQSQGSGGGSAGGGGNNTGHASGNSPAAKIFNFFEPKVGAKGASGIVGNAGQEAGGGTINIPLFVPGSESAGMFGELSNPFTPAQSNSAELQCQKVWGIMQGQSWVTKLKNAATPSDAADIFEINYEKATTYDVVGGPAADFTGGTNEGARRSVAEQAYRQWGNGNNGGKTKGNSGNGSGNGGGGNTGGGNPGTGPADPTTGNNPRGTSVEVASIDPNSTNSTNSSPAVTTDVVQAGNGRKGRQAGGSTKNSNNAANNGDKMTVYDCIVKAAHAINNKHLPYQYAGGHAQAGIPSQGPPAGFDCSGAVAAVLSAARIIKPGSPVGADNNLITELQGLNMIENGPASGSNQVNLYDYPGKHIFMSINGDGFGTDNFGNSVNQQSSGGGFTGKGTPMSEVEGAPLHVYHVKQSVLNQMTTYSLGLKGGSTVDPGGGGGGGGGGGDSSSAEAFTAELDFPSVEDMVTAIALGAEGKGFMHDQSLMPFIQQLCTASLRSFQSLPNGDFYAFYPDYFGEMGTSPPYWIIDDIEILDGGINLTDQGLSTHVYAIGDNSWPINNELVNMLFSAGTITVYNAFLGNLIVDTNSGGKSTPSVNTKVHSDAVRIGKGGGSGPGSGNNNNSKTGNTQAPSSTQQGSAQTNSQANAVDPGADLSGDIMSVTEAAKFVERYGPRPLVQDYPMVRSAIYEMLLAYQQFMMAWTSQFQTPFTFTFMPEVFPGGKVAFQHHGLQMYVEEVVHSWDYAEAGFTTTATLTAPAIWGGGNKDLPKYMVRGMVEPVADGPNPVMTDIGQTTKPGSNVAGNSNVATQIARQSNLSS